MRIYSFLLIPAIILWLGSFTYAQSNSSKSAFTVSATFVEQAPKLDGDLSDEIWKGIPIISNFTQIWPDEGADGSERTEVQIAYDRDYLYFAFKFHDKNPELIRAKNLERGGRNDRDDNAYIGLDTFMDGRNAYLFEMNALGTQDDATITDESLGIDSFSWDAVFWSETLIDDEGWSMEVAIPFRQLRFPDGDNLSFGLMIARTINRKNERVFWPDIGLEFGGAFRALAAVSQYGVLTGIKNINRGNNIEFKPYVISGAQNIRPDLSVDQQDVDYTYDAGFDLKYGISSNLTLDLSVNTDFAQVEADNVQLNLSRFNLFFPEKREFFLERSGLFEHGNQRSTQTFFSRRIGLTNQLIAGSRLTGQVGRFAVGALNIETGDNFGDFLGPGSANNTVARVRTRIANRGTAGTIFTNLETADGYNRALGFDTQYRFGSSSSFNAWFTNVWDNDETLNDAAGHASLRLRNDVYGLRAAYTNVGTNYNPALGFVRRRNIRQYDSRLEYTPVVNIPALPLVRRINLIGEYGYIEGQDGVLQSTELELESRIDLYQRDGLNFSFERNFERLFSPFEIRDGAIIPQADYTFNRFEVGGSTDSSRRMFASAGVVWGDFFNGTRTDYNFQVGFRQSQFLTVEGSFSQSRIDLPVANGEFDATTISMSILAAVNRDLFAKTLIQYDNFSRNLQANIRVNWIHTPGSDLFFVYNTAYHFVGNNEVVFDPRRDIILSDQVAVVKLTYLILL